MLRKIIIIGAGTYGSYLANCLTGKYPDDQIQLFEVGNNNTQSEREIGFISKVKDGLYRAASHGRFFGLGGTSARWGGQLLFFSHRDFADESGMREVIDCNIRYRETVLNRFFKKAPLLDEKDFDEGLFIKQGIWLKFGQRNIFKHFEISGLRNVTVHQNARVIRLNSSEGKITSVTVQLQHQKEPVQVEADIFYLTSGAFESVRLLHVSDILDARESSAGFSDHVSLRCFEISDSHAKISSQDLHFRFVNGSMITSRLVGEIDKVSFYIHPIFNEDFKFFQFLKQLLFKKELSALGFLIAGKQFYSLFPLVYSYLFKKELYIVGKWFLNIDIELSQTGNFISLSKELDRYQQNGLEIQFEISKDTTNKLSQVKEKIRRILVNANINFKEIEDSQILSSKLEDVYHPYGLFSYTGNKTIFDIYNPASNLFLFNTGLLFRSGGINPTASIFCLIEHHVEKQFVEQAV